MLVMSEKVSDHLPKTKKHHPKQRLWYIRAKEVLISSGSIERPIVFGNNDTPGVMLSSAAKEYLKVYGVLVGRNPLIFTNNDSGYETAIEFKKHGVEPIVLDSRSNPQSEIIDEAKNLGINKLWLKDERNRMGLGSFKALGATFVIASHAANKIAKERTDDDWKKSLSGETYISASAGNHGLSLAAGARIFGAKAVIYLSKNVPSTFADRIRSYGADVVIHGDDYEESLQGAQSAAEENNWFLLSDVTWDGYDYGLQVMQGYLVLAAEAYDRCLEMPTHIFLQAGVGGFPASMATLARKYFGDKPKIIIVEPGGPRRVSLAWGFSYKQISFKYKEID